jgi:uncharacterized protein
MDNQQAKPFFQPKVSEHGDQIFSGDFFPLSIYLSFAPVRGSVLKFLRRLLRVSLGLYVLGCAGLYFFQEKLFFHPVPLPANHDFAFVPPVAEFWLPVPQGRLNGLWFKASGPAKGLVLYCHGNAGNLARWGHMAAPLVAQGYDVAVWDYPGFGKSTGPLSQAHLLAHADTLYQWARRHYPPQRITLFGRSLGTGLATYLAAHHPARRLILETPYHSLTDLAAHYVPYVPYPWLLRYHLPSNEWLPRVACPVTIFHGTADEVVPYASGQKLATVAPPAHRFVTIPGGQHNNLDQFAAYRTALAQTLAEP